MSDGTRPKPGAKLDPKGTALVKKLQALTKQTRTEFGDHVGSIRIKPKSLPPSENCSCACGCS